ncbi:hypothetical protein PROFUN_02743 [Planoprotostelium fungivorum]|uniref:GYF domain-containing protein n=1 Tax=Planoprotostelium fungivorum TaxID=1890364 RepID=A0A2P6NXG3_9EUKA|nr:hypothetical protein PROFUN_02743 [Planoprotostelium fungivorum]
MSEPSNAAANSQERFQPEWMSSKKSLSSSGQNSSGRGNGGNANYPSRGGSASSFDSWKGPKPALNYTRKQLLDMYRPSELPAELVGFSTIAVVDSLTPMALLPIEQQEEEATKHLKQRANGGGRGGGPYSLSSSTNSLTAPRNPRQPNMGRGRSTRADWNAPAPSKAPAWAQESYARGGGTAGSATGRSSLHASLDDGMFRGGRETFAFGVEDDSLGALSQQTLMMAAVARQSLSASGSQINPATVRKPDVPEEPENIFWVYKDPLGNVQGPFSNDDMHGWFVDGYFNDGLMLKKQNEAKFLSLGQLLQQHNGRSPFSAPPPPALQELEPTVIPPHLSNHDPLSAMMSQPQNRGRQGLSHSIGSFEGHHSQGMGHHSDISDSRVLMSDHSLLARESEREMLVREEPSHLFERLGLGHEGHRMMHHEVPPRQHAWGQPMQEQVLPMHMMHPHMQHGMEMHGGWNEPGMHRNQHMHHMPMPVMPPQQQPSHLGTRREGVFMLDESQFMPVRTADQHIPKHTVDPNVHNGAHGTAYPQMWGQPTPYAPVAQQVFHNSQQTVTPVVLPNLNVAPGPSALPHPMENPQPKREEPFWSQSKPVEQEEKKPQLPPQQTVVEQQVIQEKKKNVAPAQPPSNMWPVGGQNKKTLKEIQEEEMVQQMAMQQQAEANHKQAAAAAAARQREEEAARAAATWKSSSNGANPNTLSLREIQDQEKRERIARERQEAERRQQQVVVESSNPRWNNNGAPWGGVSQGSNTSLKDILVQETRQKVAPAPVPMAVTQPTKKKSEGINLGAWGAPMVKQSKPSLRDIQAAEVSGGPATVAQIVKQLPPKATAAAPAPTPAASVKNDTDLFWEVTEDKPAAPQKPVTPVKAATPVKAQEEFPSLGAKRPAEDIQSWSLSQLKTFVIPKNTDAQTLHNGLMRTNGAGEAKEFLKGKLPQGENLNRYINEFVRRKGKAVPAPATNPAPAPAPAPIAAVAPAAVVSTNGGNSSSLGGKKKKGKMVVDPKMLGFSVNNTTRWWKRVGIGMQDNRTPTPHCRFPCRMDSCDAIAFGEMMARCLCIYEMGSLPRSLRRLFLPISIIVFLLTPKRSLRVSGAVINHYHHHAEIDHAKFYKYNTSQADATQMDLTISSPWDEMGDSSCSSAEDLPKCLQKEEKTNLSQRTSRHARYDNMTNRRSVRKSLKQLSVSKIHHKYQKAVMYSKLTSDNETIQPNKARRIFKKICAQITFFPTGLMSPEDINQVRFCVWDSIYRLGIIYSEGIHVKPDWKRAYSYFSLISDPLTGIDENGYREAQLYLGTLLLSGGHGLEMNEPEGIKYMHKAACQGSTEAQFVLATYLEKYGAREEAYHLYMTALRKEPNELKIKDSIRMLSASLTDEELLSAFQRFQESPSLESSGMDLPFLHASLHLKVHLPPGIVTSVILPWRAGGRLRYVSIQEVEIEDDTKRSKDSPRSRLVQPKRRKGTQQNTHARTTNNEQHTRTMNIQIESKNMSSMTSADRDEYDVLFKTADIDQDDKISGVEAFQYFSQSGLPRNVLANVWFLSDAGAKGYLTQTEFRVATHIVFCLKQGDTLPSALPKSLLASALDQVRTNNNTRTRQPISPTSNASGIHEPDWQKARTEASEVMKQTFSCLESGKFQQAAERVSVALNLLTPFPDKLQREVELCRDYSKALDILENSKKFEEEGDPITSAALIRFLSEIPIQPKHQLVCIRMSITKNFTLKNFGITAAAIQTLVKMNPAEEALMRPRLNYCKDMMLKDNALPYYECFYCHESVSPSSTHCSMCNAPIQPNYWINERKLKQERNIQSKEEEGFSRPDIIVVHKVPVPELRSILKGGSKWKPRPEKEEEDEDLSQSSTVMKRNVMVKEAVGAY